MQYQAQYNKHWLTAVDLDEHQHLFHESDDLIKMVNNQADISGDPNALRLGHNNLSDLKPEEKIAVMGVIMPADIE